jgi:hypothetical protein
VRQLAEDPVGDVRSSAREVLKKIERLGAGAQAAG